MRAASSSKRTATSVSMEADAIFVELGLQPNSDMLGELVELEADGRIKVDVQ